MRPVTRRIFSRAAAAAALLPQTGRSAEPLPPLTDGVKIGTRLSPDFTDEDIAFFRTHGIEYATIWTTSENCNYDYFSLTRKKLEAAGIRLLNIGNLGIAPGIGFGLFLLA